MAFAPLEVVACTATAPVVYHPTQTWQDSDLAGWVKQESEVAIKLNSLWKLKKVFV